MIISRFEKTKNLVRVDCSLCGKIVMGCDLNEDEKWKFDIVYPEDGLVLCGNCANNNTEGEQSEPYRPPPSIIK